jgi:hypothetical protein
MQDHRHKVCLLLSIISTQPVTDKWADPGRSGLPPPFIWTGPSICLPLKIYVYVCIVGTFSRAEAQCQIPQCGTTGTDFHGGGTIFKRGRAVRNLIKCEPQAMFRPVPFLQIIDPPLNTPVTCIIRYIMEEQVFRGKHLLYFKEQEVWVCSRKVMLPLYYCETINQSSLCQKFDTFTCCILFNIHMAGGGCLTSDSLL